MTDTREKRSRGPGAMPVIVATLCGFLILLTILSDQMRTGRDPAIKPSATAERPRTILERRIIEKRVIITDAPAPSAGSPTLGASPVGGQVAASPPAPVTRAAPVQAAPVAPAPPPPPAPVTRTS
jgi:hypothetical protein